MEYTKFFVKNKRIFSNQSQKIKYSQLTLTQNDFNLEKNENIFLKNKEIIEKIDKLLNLKELIIYGIIDNFDKLKLKIQKSEIELNFTQINEENSIELEEKSSYNLVLEQIEKKLNSNLKELETIEHKLKHLINSNSEKENQIFQEKENKINSLKNSIKFIKKTQENFESELQKNYNLKIKNLEKKCAKLNKEKHINKLFKQENKIKKNLENLKEKEKIQKIKLKTLEHKKKISKLGLTLPRTILAILTLGLSLYTNLFSYSHLIQQKKKKISKLQIKQNQQNQKLEQIKLNLNNPKFETYKQKTNQYKQEIQNLIKEQTKQTPKTNQYTKKIEKHQETIFIIETEIKNLKNTSSKKITQKLQEKKQTLQNQKQEIENLINKLNSQNIELKDSIIKIKKQ